jgi:hypothetical protein
VAARAPAPATLKYGALQFSGNLDTFNVVRHPDVDKLQFIQNRNTVRLRVDWDWLEKGKLMERIDIPIIDRSKVYILYRGVYDGFYDIAPTDRQVGQTPFDDLVGGPVSGNDAGRVDANGNLLPGLYSRFKDGKRTKFKFENRLREAYVDLKLKGLPLSFRLGRQQVIWGESDQFRLMDIWNPIDLTWHLQQVQSWDEIRVPLWLGKGLWDIGEVGPLSNAFLEVVYNPFDFQPNQKFEFLPAPWAVFLPNPVRDGQVQRISQGFFATRFNLNGSSFRRGTFKRNPAEASEVGARFHAVTPQGIEWTANYLYGRARGVGAGAPLGVRINAIDPHLANPQVVMAADGSRARFALDNGATILGTRAGNAVRWVDVDAEVVYPYMHVFGFTGNYFEGDFTGAVLRWETAYALGNPVQTIDPARTTLADGTVAPLQLEKSDIWAGMIGFDRPTWIRILNPKATWFLTGQFFWSYYTENTTNLRGNSGAGEAPYFTPESGQPGHNSRGVGVWLSGPFAGLTERTQNASLRSADDIRRWEHLITFAGTSFYRGGTLVPFVAAAWDPVNSNAEFVWYLDFFYTNNFIISMQQKYFTTYGSKAPSDDPWGAGGRNHRRDETGLKLTYQF